MRMTPLQKLSVSVGAALIILGLFAGGAYYYASRLVSADRAVERANSSMAAANRVLQARQDGELVTKAYVVRPDTQTRAGLIAAQSRVEDALDVLTRSNEDNPRQHALIVQLASRASKSLEAFRATLLIRDHVGVDSAKRFLANGPPASEGDSLLRIVGRMRDEDFRVLAEQTRQQSEHSASAQRVILVGMVLTFLLAGVALQPMRAEIATRITTHIVREHITGANELVEETRSHAAATAAQLLALHRLIAALAEARDAEAGARALVDAGKATLRASLAAVIVPHGAGGFTVLASSDPSFTAIAPELTTPVADVLRTGEVAIIESRSARERQWGTQAALDMRGAQGSALVVPLARDRAVTGVFLSVRADDHVFGDDELTFAASLGRLGGQAIAS